MIAAALADNSLAPEAKAASERIEASRATLPDEGFLTHGDYATWCAEYGLPVIEDERMDRWGGPSVGGALWPRVPVEQILAEDAKLCRLRGLERERAVLRARG